jgi:hypothetical protein
MIRWFHHAAALLINFTTFGIASCLSHHPARSYERTVEFPFVSISIIFPCSDFIVLLCPFALTWIDIAFIAPWLETRFRLLEDPALRLVRHPPLPVFLHFIDHRAGHLHLPHHIAPLFCNWI